MALSLLPEVQREIIAAVDEACGAEVFFGAAVSAAGKVAGVEVLARGDADEVPAMLATLDVWDLVIHNHPSGDLRPSKADLGVAAAVASAGKGFAIVDNRASRMYVVVEPPLPAERTPVAEEDVERFFASDGPLAAAAGEYESRPGQLAMAKSVADAFNAERVCAVEAGTGSGKSFAYLAPAIMYAKANRVRVIVATGTINLQEQLIGKDLPVLRRAFGAFWDAPKEEPFQYALIKGRGNYLCRRRVKELLAEPEQLALAAEDDREQAELDQVLAWAVRTEEGTLSDLPFHPRAGVWEHVQSDGDRCFGVRCPEFRACAYFRARMQASRASILVVNHHLFFADLAARSESGNRTATLVLPPWQHVIFDEAHDLEDAASSFFGTTLAAHGVLRRLGKLKSAKRAGRGALPALQARLLRAGETALAAEIEGAVGPAIDGARALVGSFFDLVRDRVGARAGTGGPEPSLRYRGEDDPWGEVFRACLECAASVGGLKAHIAKLRDALGDRGDDDESLRPAATELHAACRRLDALQRELEFFADARDTEQVRWVEMRTYQKRAYAVCRAAPLLVGPQLEEHLWRTTPTCVLTSATLSVDGKIAYLADRLGLSGLGGTRFAFLQVPSPFDWERQAVLLVPADIAEVGTPLFAEECTEWIVEACRITRGRAFVLFTSYGMLEQQHRAARAALEDLQLEVLAQKALPRTQLLARFKESGRGVLFGTDSFWQGVDVRGEALSCVIIARLPFEVPTEPLQVARMEDIKARGKDPFRAFALPQAVLKLRQGFGRLIRSRTDRGAVIVLDKRMATRSYGRIFMRSLPPVRAVVGDRGRLLAALAEFFGERARPAEKCV
ncbi:MAG TPA: helicase [Planctomycetes bacterium]|nr:helicase [Planctomycetota bacterium]